jgi:peptidoglycan/LPS O-acetylase OafA/YrhL
MKQHYQVLDGLRGTAALTVVVFHVLEMLWPEPVQNPLHHAYLAVDFFFMLSGFIVGHAYDDRLPKMGFGQFLRVRARRLHPLALLGLVIGLGGYLLDPFAPTQKTASAGSIALTFGLMLLTLPSPGLPNRYGETHSLNGPTWTLFQEYLANIVYGLIGPRLGKRGLAVVVVVAGAALLAVASTLKHLGTGWGWDTFWIAPVRTAFPFFAGLLLHRLGARLKSPLGFGLLSLVLLAVFAAPFAPNAGKVSLNGLMEAGFIILVFPLVIVAGAAAPMGFGPHGWLGKLCAFSGAISYPLYITHYPFIYIFGHWVWTTKPPRDQIAWVGAGMIVFVVALAWAAMRFYDTPLRAWLARRAAARPRVAEHAA